MSDIELIKLFVNKMMDNHKDRNTDFETGLYYGYEGVKTFIESLEKFHDKKENK